MFIKSYSGHPIKIILQTTNFPLYILLYFSSKNFNQVCNFYSLCLAFCFTSQRQAMSMQSFHCSCAETDDEDNGDTKLSLDFKSEDAQRHTKPLKAWSAAQQLTGHNHTEKEGSQLLIFWLFNLMAQAPNLLFIKFTTDMQNCNSLPVCRQTRPNLRVQGFKITLSPPPPPPPPPPPISISPWFQTKKLHCNAVTVRGPLLQPEVRAVQWPFSPSKAHVHLMAVTAFNHNSPMVHATLVFHFTQDNFTGWKCCLTGTQTSTPIMWPIRK